MKIIPPLFNSTYIFSEKFGEIFPILCHIKIHNKVVTIKYEKKNKRPGELPSSNTLIY